MAASNTPAGLAAAAQYLAPISAAGLPTAQMGQAINGLTTGVVTSTTGKPILKVTFPKNHVLNLFIQPLEHNKLPR